MSKSPAPFDQGLFLMHLHKGKEYFDQNQLQKARTELESAFKLRPQDDKVLNMLGMTYFKLEMLPQAEEMYVGLAANNPDIYTLQSNLGLIRFKLEKLSEAEDSLRRALELQPTNPKAHFYLGLLYEKLGNWEASLNHFQQAKADKMVSKIQEKMAKEKKSEKLLAFEVLEVLEEVAQEAEQTEIFRPAESAQVSDRNPFAPEEEQTMLLSKETLRNQSGWIERDFTSTLRQVQEEVFPSASVPEPPFDSEEGTMFFSRAQYDAAQNSKAESDSTPEVTVDESTAAGEYPEAVQQEEPPAPFREEDRATLQREWAEDGFGTGKMRRKDVMEVMDRLEEQEPEVEELLEDLSSVPAMGEEQGSLESSKEFEIVFSTANDSVAEPNMPAEEAVLEELTEVRSWEKTDPTIVTFEAEATDIVQPKSEISEELAGSETTGGDSAFLLDDEQTAADISSFLAQSRSGDEPVPAPNPEELEEPTVVLSRNLIEERLAPAPDESGSFDELIASEVTEVRIPTPEEVENEGLAPVEESVPATESQLSEEDTEQRDLIEEWHLQPATAGPRHVADSTQMMNPVEAPASEFPPANLDQFSRDRFHVQPLIGADRFLLIDPHLLEIIISERLICRRGSISSYTGNLQFSPWLTEYEKTIPLIQVDGSGIVFLSDKRKEIFMLSLNNETIFVESNHLLVAQSALKVEPYIMEQSGASGSLSIVKVSGRGTLAVTCMTKPLTLNVYQAMPVNIPADALIVWSGNLKNDFVNDDELRKIMMFSDEDEEVMLLRFSGNGDVVVEQGSLWGDRRAKK